MGKRYGDRMREAWKMQLSHFYHSTLTRKGQATIPVELREKLGLKEGDKLVWREIDGVITVVSASDHVRRTAGMLKPLIDPTIPSPSLEEMDSAIEAAVVDDFVSSESRR
jgi:AbrB family looped-hinge helix DNA binding protein